MATAAPTKNVICHFENRNIFLRTLEHNPGLIIVKFGAEWCGPCKKIKPMVDSFFASSPDTVLCCDIDVDESFDVYAYLKSKKMLNGIPAILCYIKGNLSPFPDNSVSGADPIELDAFFKRCSRLLLMNPELNARTLK